MSFTEYLKEESVFNSVESSIDKALKDGKDKFTKKNQKMLAIWMLDNKIKIYWDAHEVKVAKGNDILFKTKEPKKDIKKIIDIARLHSLL